MSNNEDERLLVHKGKLVVFGAGLPRTGTSSACAALEQLLGGHCYHMKSVYVGGRRDIDFWSRAIRRAVRDEEWEHFLVGHRKVVATTDYPVSFYWKKLLHLFPDAKVILTTRQPDTWHRSVKESVYAVLKLLERFPVSWVMTMLGMTSKFRVPREVCSAIPDGFDHSLVSAIEAGEEASLQFFNKWQEEVIATVPKERLLVFQAKDGWEPLCEFLGVPVPDGPYPRVNETATAKKVVKGLKVFSWCVVAVFLVLVVVAAAAVGVYFGYFHQG